MEVGERVYVWVFNVSGIYETEKNKPIRVLGFGSQIPSDFSFDPKVQDYLTQTGFIIDEDAIDSLLGEGSYTFLDKVFSKQNIEESEHANRKKAIMKKVNILDEKYFESMCRYFFFAAK